MKYLLILALLVSTVCTDESNEESIQDVETQPEIEAANVYQMNMMNRMRYSMMGNAMAPPQQAIEYYSTMNDEDFPIDYSLSCSNTCNCRTFCVMYWWVPCNCACPPSCDNNQNDNNNRNNNNNNNNRFPPIEWQPEQPRPIFPRFTTTPVPIWNGRPEWINPMPPRWPEWNDPHNPNNHPTFAPPVRQTTRRPWNPQPIQPPIWINPGPWNPNNPNNHPTFPPPVRSTTSNPNWWRPNPPNPSPPNWWDQQPVTNPPNWWDQQPVTNPPNWWNQQPATNPPNWWNQQPQPIEEPCNDSCSCVPCTVIWICPPACSPSCCAARGFGNAENVDETENKNVNVEPQPIEPLVKLQRNNQNIPDYLKDVFEPGKI